MLLMDRVFFHFACMGHTLQLGILKAYDLGPVKATLARVCNRDASINRCVAPSLLWYKRCGQIK